MSANRVLFIGDSETFPTSLSEPFAHWGARIHFARSRAQASRLMKRYRFRMVLSKLRLPDATAVDLIALLRGRQSDLFSYLPVEKGFLWLQLVKSGKERMDGPPMQTLEFLHTAEESLNEVTFKGWRYMAPELPYS